VLDYCLPNVNKLGINISFNRTTKTLLIAISIALFLLNSHYIFNAYAQHSGSATSGSATSGNAISGNATSGSATSGSATSGNAISGSATSGSATSGNAISGNATSGGGNLTSSSPSVSHNPSVTVSG
jgi:hypothetical protein